MASNEPKSKFIEDMTTKDLYEAERNLNQSDPHEAITAKVLQAEIDRREFGHADD